MASNWSLRSSEGPRSPSSKSSRSALIEKASAVRLRGWMLGWRRAPAGRERRAKLVEREARQVTRLAARDIKRVDESVHERVCAAVDGLRGRPDGRRHRAPASIAPPRWCLRVGDSRVRFNCDPKPRTVLVLPVLPRVSMAIEFSPLAATNFPSGGHFFSPLVATNFLKFQSG